MQVYLKFLLFLCLAFFAGNLFASGFYSNNVYQVVSNKCPVYENGSLVKKKNTAQTGFSYAWKGKQYVVTALHGVLGCESISVSIGSPEEDRRLRLFGFKIKLVDIDKDLAMISGKGAVVKNSEFESFNTHADLNVLGINDDRRNIKLHVFGYPNATRARFGAESTATKYLTLKEIFSTNKKLMSALDKRSSPSSNTKVITVSQGAEPGLSGAPLVYDYNKRLVVGVINGGLSDSGLLKWAVAFDNVNWKIYREDDIRLSNVIKSGTKWLFKSSISLEEKEIEERKGFRTIGF